MFTLTARGTHELDEFRQFDWLEHGFGTKLSGDWPRGERATLLQTHSDTAIVVDGERNCVGEGDALITARPGVFISVRSADCVPILLVDSVHRVVAAVHAGWRGTVKQIAVSVLTRMCRAFDTRPTDVFAAIGPSIGGCCYTVGADVATQFGFVFPERADLGGETKIDLTLANTRLLEQAGIPAGQIYNASICTYCNPELESYRRDGVQSRRMVSGVRILDH